MARILASRFAAVLVAFCFASPLLTEALDGDQQKVVDHIKNEAASAMRTVKKARKRVNNSPPMHWGELAGQMGFSNRVEEPWKKLAGLWEESSMANVMESFPRLPMHPNFATSDFIIESRLSEGSHVIDYSIKLLPEEFAAYSAHPFVREFATHSTQWRDCLTFLETFPTSGFHSELWMEFDQSTGPDAPSVFVAPENWMRTLLMASEIEKIVGYVPSTERAMKLLEALLIKVWSPFWSSMPWLNSTQKEVRSRILDVLLLANDRYSVYQVGFWLARDTGTVRLVLEDEKIYQTPEWWKNTTAWWAGLKEPLVDMGWRWTDDERPNLLDEYMPKLLVGISHTYPAINIMAGGVTSKVGFEMYFDREVISEAIEEHGAASVDEDARPRPEPYLDVLVQLGLCSPEKRMAALDGGIGGTNDDGIKVPGLEAQGLTFRSRVLTNHIKVTFEPGRPVEAKLYTAARVTWTNPPDSGSKKRRKAPADSEL